MLHVLGSVIARVPDDVARFTVTVEARDHHEGVFVMVEPGPTGGEITKPTDWAIEVRRLRHGPRVDSETLRYRLGFDGDQQTFVDYVDDTIRTGGDWWELRLDVQRR